MDLPAIQAELDAIRARYAEIDERGAFVLLIVRGSDSPTLKLLVSPYRIGGRDIFAEGSYFAALAASVRAQIDERDPVLLDKTLGIEPPKKTAAYGEWCREPALCAGKGYCPRDPTCGD